MGQVQFGVPRDLVLWARDQLNAQAFIETGTNRAQTSRWASEHFPKVATIEGQEALYNAARNSYGHLGIDFRLGDSSVLLAEVLAALDQPCVLWLDAHWCGDGTFDAEGECPLLDELRAVNESPHEHMVLIDDARLFVAPPPPPHKSTAWPDMLQVTRALDAGRSGRYAAIYDDVIVAVPEAHSDQLVAFLRESHIAKARQTPLAKKVLRQAFRRLDLL